MAGASPRDTFPWILRLTWWKIFEDTASPAPIRTSEIPSVQNTPSASHFETKGEGWVAVVRNPEFLPKPGICPKIACFWGNLGCFYGFRLFYVLVSIFTVAFLGSYFCFCGQPGPNSDVGDPQRSKNAIGEPFGDRGRGGWPSLDVAFPNVSDR